MRPVVLAALAILAGCSYAGVNAASVREPCAGHACAIQLTNHSPANVTVRYADSTGRRELIGLIQAAETKTFTVQWVHSAGIRIFAASKEYGLYAADVAFDRARPVTEVHFPDNFSPVSDTLMPVRRPR